MVYYFSFITLKKHFKPCSFILKALKDILQYLKLVNSWFRFFDVTNRLKVMHCMFVSRSLLFKNLIRRELFNTTTSTIKLPTVFDVDIHDFRRVIIYNGSIFDDYPILSTLQVNRHFLHRIWHLLFRPFISYIWLLRYKILVQIFSSSLTLPSYSGWTWTD